MITLSTHSLHIESSDAMEQLGNKLGRRVLESTNGLIIFLIGNLGAGKTTLVRGFLRAMHYEGIVKSPTYTLVEPYELEEALVYHFDFYRLNSPQELELMGIRDYFSSQGSCLIEWPEKAIDVLPVPDLKIFIEIENTSRQVNIEAISQRGHDVLQFSSFS